ncbi:hypothetical protein J5690_05130 [bacterium]|nr:hypothetical protein [bacterium]
MSDNNSGEKKMLTGKEMHNRIETLLAFLNRNLRGREEAINLSLLSAVAMENIILFGRSSNDKELIHSCIQSAFKDSYDVNHGFYPRSLNNPSSFNALFSMKFSLEAYPENEEDLVLNVEVKPIANDDDFFNFVNSPSFEKIPNPDKEQKAAMLAIEEVQKWQQVIDRVELSEEAKKVISEIRRKCFEYYVSDSRWKRIVHVLKTCAFLNGRSKVDLIDCLLIDYAIPNNFVEEILKRHAVESKLDSRQHAQYKANIFTRQKYYKILKLSVDDKKLELEHKEENLY